MKITGLIGGMSWESTSLYYTLLNERVNESLGGFHSCNCLIYSVDFASIEKWQAAGETKLILNEMHSAVKRLEKAGADLILLCANTIHQYYDEVQSKTNIPILHIADAAGKTIRHKALKKPALLGTRYTMEGDFYAKRLRDLYQLDPVIPSMEDRQFIHDLIFNELIKGIIKEDSRKKLLEIIEKLKLQGADCAVLACTEIPLLIRQEHVDLPIIDTTKEHVQAAIKMIL
mgnify:CR=1 FL=1|jgi:aspartate racemase